ncbi:SAM-dependent methyltransferase [Nocardia amikacinitolerans]|uniref:SAM-dependent methyltransferase n=1 Tax=Nocardia amikacinitolerans TaxID=756689 RepID=UPI0020A5E7DC|nr:SAM-dependent methyltransferase [Nocardia amikacinitolerans]MCP2292566.1 methyltransferase, TIGR00027 family [Nocardia amikacinitolerans]
MKDTTLKVPVAGAAVTAIGVAAIRFRETERADRLYDDSLARVFVEAARTGFSADRWEQLSALADRFYEPRTVGVRLVDDRVRAALDAGIRQFVLLGAGLDTRAFRMNMPPDAVVYELDLPELFAFKEPVLIRVGAQATCLRRVVVADLRRDWQKPLLDKGFEVDMPTYWVDEGTLGRLTQAWNQRVVMTVTELSASRSRFDASRLLAEPDGAAYRELRRLVAGEASSDDALTRGSDAAELDVEGWLAELGWSTEFRSWNDMVAPFGRSVTVSDRQIGSIAAVRNDQTPRKE